MWTVLPLLLGLAALSAAHYDGYPFKHVNDGKYGADHPYANYGNHDNHDYAPAAGHGHGYDNDPGYDQGYGYGHGYGQAYGYGNGFYGYGRNHEFDFRQFAGYPVHYGGGQFYFLGHYDGRCDGAHPYGFYRTDDANSFMVCDNGRAHRFACPKGTAHRHHSHFEQGTAYGVHELCGLNLNDNKVH